MMNKDDSSSSGDGPGSKKRQAGEATGDYIAQRLSDDPMAPFPKRSRTDAGTDDTAKVGNSESKEARDPADKAEKDFKIAGVVAEVSVHASSSTNSRNVPIPAEEGVTFPERLMELVMDETDKEALWWLPDGNYFCIHSKKFTKTILANNFQGSKFESFTRKLARWGFTRVSTSDAPAHTFIFEHPLFKKSRPELAKEISGSKKQRMSAVAAAAKARSDPTPPSRNAAPTPAPWPTFSQESATTASLAAAAPAGESDISSQSIPQGGTLTNEYQNALSRQLQQPDIEQQLLLRSMMNSLQNAPRQAVDDSHRGQRHDAFAAALLAQQDRARALGTMSGTSNTSSTVPAFEGAQGSNRGLPSGGYPMSSFILDNQSLPNMYQQQAAALPQGRERRSSSSTNASSVTGGVDPLVRLYLQQQETQRQENIRLQQELLLQELWRRERDQRDNRGQR